MDKNEDFFYILCSIVLLLILSLLTNKGFNLAIFSYDEIRPYITKASSPFCYSRLKNKDISFTKISNQGRGQCRVLKGVRVLSVGTARFKSPVIMTCGLALDFSEWMDDVHHLSKAHFQAPVKIIDSLGTYNCRRQRNRPVLSEHAYGNAIDIKGFNIGGRYYSIEKDWVHPERHKFFKAIYNSACREFGLALGPDSNRSHHDHFHLDNGNYFGLFRILC